jgi:hypothetical protein
MKDMDKQISFERENGLIPEKSNDAF